MVIKNMGAYLLYMLINPEQAAEATLFLDTQPEQKQLNQHHRGVWFWAPEDRNTELKRLKETGCGVPDFMKIGEGSWKASGLSIEEEPCYELVAQLFKKLHQQFKIKIYRGSCALSGDYFNEEQTKCITKNGEALSSEKKKIVVTSESNPEKKYTVVYDYETKHWTCSCPGYIYHNHGNPEFECKHISACKKK